MVEAFGLWHKRVLAELKSTKAVDSMHGITARTEMKRWRRQTARLGKAREACDAGAARYDASCRGHGGRHFVAICRKGIRLEEAWDRGLAGWGQIALRVWKGRASPGTQREERAELAIVEMEVWRRRTVQEGRWVQWWAVQEQRQLGALRMGRAAKHCFMYKAGTSYRVWKAKARNMVKRLGVVIVATCRMEVSSIARAMKHWLARSKMQASTQAKATHVVVRCRVLIALRGWKAWQAYRTTVQNSRYIMAKSTGRHARKWKRIFCRRWCAWSKTAKLLNAHFLVIKKHRLKATQGMTIEALTCWHNESLKVKAIWTQQGGSLMAVRPIRAQARKIRERRRDETNVSLVKFWVNFTKCKQKQRNLAEMYLAFQ